MTSPHVLLVTKSDDNDCVEWVARALRRRGAKAWRLDTDAYPSQARVSSLLGAQRIERWLELGRRRVDLERLSAVWYRRFNAAAQLPASLGDVLPACVDESRRTLLGAIAATSTFQLDPLRAVRRCDHKELQLRQALALGLDIPQTLITNSPEAVRPFFVRLKGRVITKMQHSFAVHREGRELVVHTNEVTEADLDRLSGLTLSPMTFQEKLDKRVELRATVVGRRVFTAAVDSQALAGSKVDWRKEGIALLGAWKPYALPRAVERRLLALTKWFGLNYAAADFVVTPEGRHVFLEINAGGEFFWLAKKPGLPIVDALADVLLGRAARAAEGTA